MLAPDSFPLYPQTCIASGVSKYAVSAEHYARQNQLLAMLPAEDDERLRPYLEPVPLPMGWPVHGAGGRERYLYFITEGIVSRFYETENGASAYFAVTGRDGMIGVASFLGGNSTPSQAVVLSPGYAYRLRASLVKNEFEHGSALSHVLLCYIQTLIVQIGQSAVCNRHHSVQQQLCRWILSCLDRLPSNELAMTQEVIADMLGVRRESVTDAAGKLQAAGLIHYSRGHITVLDRPRLEAHACECYAVVKRAHDCVHQNIGNTACIPR